MWNHIINIYSSELLSTKIKESRINELKKKNALQYQKLRIKKIYRKITFFYLIIFLQDFLKS